MQCRVLPYEAGDGPWNMAVDQWMLDSVVADPSMAMFRTYEWSVPTLSLGYFQHRAEADADPRWRKAALVRRSTGGGAIWHDRELTYALVLPANHPLTRRSKDLYRAVHQAIVGLLSERGIVARRRGEAEARVGRDRPLLCFLDRDAEDLVVDGSKVLGSAQRRRAGALLQHGSLLLDTSEQTPELPGLAALAPEKSIPSPATWADLVQNVLFKAVELDPIIQVFTRAERDAADRLAHAVYRDPGWTDRR
ncbi:lipoate--protein ligase family protein [Tautonia rosea]|uniref:lipoate--protein ligase family protein n=1 Tax=Tautonia rosea TaxID=2728037 RepID=UPI001F2FA9F5|nr:lipoate--protein ligase [Tautonia rosea]